MCKLHLCKLHLFVVAGLLGVLVLALGACNGEKSLEEYPCPPEGTKLTYTSFGAGFMGANCQTCHGAPTDDRKGAPSGYDFGTLDGVREHRARIFARAAGKNDSMPPGPDDPPEAERTKLAEWLACGAP